MYPNGIDINITWQDTSEKLYRCIDPESIKINNGYLFFKHPGACQPYQIRLETIWKAQPIL